MIIWVKIYSLRNFRKLEDKAGKYKYFWEQLYDDSKVAIYTQ